MEYLGFLVNPYRIRPINNKVEAIVNMMPPKNQNQVHVFIGLLNCYRDMWVRRSHLLQPLTTLTSDKVMFIQTDVEHKSFDDIKRIVVRYTLLVYPYFKKCFDIHTDASDFQIGAVIGQVGKPIAFYSRKLTGP